MRPTPLQPAAADSRPRGLGPLEASTPSWVDWLDERGAWQGGGRSTAAGARFRRRWGILAAGRGECLHLWVEVVPTGLSHGNRAVHAGGVQCPWGVEAP